MPSNAGPAPVRPVELAVLAVATLLLLLPFLSKPLHVDDPLFVWQARQVAAHPLDPYGFGGNWLGVPQRFYQFMQNPPLVGYYLAAASAVVGWGEVGLHTAMVPVGVATAIGTYVLAARFCRRPLAAAMLLLATPAFVISATSLMCDGPLTCLWVWAVYLWVRGSDDGGWRGRIELLGGGVLVAAATLTKYPGINLLPLLAAYAVLRCRMPRELRTARSNPAVRHPLWVQGLALLIPVLTLIAYDRGTAVRYGVGLVWDAAAYTHTSAAHRPITPAARCLSALCYLGGGGLAIGAITVPGTSWRSLGCAAVSCAGLGLLASRCFALPTRVAAASASPHWPFLLQAGLLGTAGVAVLMVSLRGAGDREGLFLLVWVGGVLLFATFLNWTMNVRSLLPMMPAACILAVRAMDHAGGRAFHPLRFYGTTAVAATVAILVAAADTGFAVAQRAGVERVMRDIAAAPRTTADRHTPQVWFGGHWGFQYDMQLAGGRPLDYGQPGRCRPGDWVVLTVNNYGSEVPPIHLAAVEQVSTGSGGRLATVNESAGAAFYASNGSTLPFVVGPETTESFIVDRVLP